MKDAIVKLDGRSGILASHLNFGDPRRGWDFRSLGRGGVNFEEIIRAFEPRAATRAPCRSSGKTAAWPATTAQEACEFIRRIDFQPSDVAFDAAFDKKEQAKA